MNGRDERSCANDAYQMTAGRGRQADAGWNDAQEPLNGPFAATRSVACVCKPHTCVPASRRPPLPLQALHSVLVCHFYFSPVTHLPPTLLSFSAFCPSQSFKIGIARARTLAIPSLAIPSMHPLAPGHSARPEDEKMMCLAESGGDGLQVAQTRLEGK